MEERPMIRMSIPLSVVLICSALAGCSISGGDPGPVVYVAGYHFDASNVAAYWTDDGTGISEVDLHAGTDSEATDIYVDAGGTVYVAGYYLNGLEYVAAYWVDDGATVTEHKLHDSSDAQATGIFVGADGTVYVSGYYDDGTYDAAAYWVDDGSTVALRNLHGTSDSVATDIYVDAGGDVYASGYRSGPIAVYWADDGVFVTESDIHTGLSDANAIFAEGADVYVAGRYMPDATVLAAYWTGSVWHDLTSAAGNAWDLVRYGGQTYTAGDYSIPGPGRRAAYWTGTAETGLNGNLSNTFAFGIYVYEGDVYVAGVQNTANSSADSGTEAVYWRNGVVAELTAGGGSRGNAIFVR